MIKCSLAMMRHFINKDQPWDVIKSKADILFYSSISNLCYFVLQLNYILKGNSTTCFSYQPVQGVYKMFLRSKALNNCKGFKGVQPQPTMT